ncbi:MAG: AI-2E family transporter [bacterium]|nr:AI-2E family transporter [bacterium]
MEINIKNRTIFRVLGVIVAFAVLVFVTTKLKTQIVWVGIAFFMAMALEPAVNKLSKFMPKKSRGLAVIIVMLVTVALFSIIAFSLLPPIIGQLNQLVKNFPTYFKEFLDSNNFLSNFLREHNLTELLSSNKERIIGTATNAGGGFIGIFGSIISAIIGLITIIVLTFFMVLEGPKWAQVFWRYQPKDKLKHRRELAHRMHRTVSGYVNGNLFTSLIAAISTTTALLILRVPYAVALGLLVGILDLIPMIGTALAAVIVTTVGLVFGGWTVTIILIIFFITYQLIENNILQPIVFSKTIDISPLVVGISALFGGVLFGLIGALVAIPAAASLQILIKDYLDQRYKR